MIGKAIHDKGVNTIPARVAAPVNRSYPGPMVSATSARKPYQVFAGFAGFAAVKATSR